MKARDILASWYADDETLIFGHRGAMAYAPMNTIPAFELAYEQGADGIELDVHLSKDGELVIVHDFTVDHTTNGEGTVTEMTLAELKTLDAGSWFDAKFEGIRIPTLSEVFEAVGDKLYVNVEIKTLSQDGDGTEEAVAECIRQHNLGERVLISSFNVSVLRRFRVISPNIPLARLLHHVSVFNLRPEDRLFYDWSEVEAFHPSEVLWHRRDPNRGSRPETAGNFVNCWTVNDVDVAKELVTKHAVNGIITDKPDIMVKALR
ncbi:MAG: glycerophosphodiester phosphodiesterase family protein [Chloroflexota bacterium]